MPSGFTCPSWLRPRTYHVPRRLSPSADSLVSFQPGALTGLAPSELDLTEIASASRPRLPLLRLAILVASSRRLSLLWNLPTIGWFLSSSSNKAETLSLVDHWCHALWRMRHCCAQRPRFRGLIPLPVEITTARFLRLVATLALLGFRLLGTFPFPWPRVSRPLCSPFSVHNRLHSRSDGTEVPSRPSCARPLPLGTSGNTRSGFFSLCFRVSKSWEVGLPLPRPPAP
jgi:hypothetical protein